MLYPPGVLTLNSTVAAARSRERGPTLSEQRAELQRNELKAAAEAEAAKEKRAVAKAAAKARAAKKARAASAQSEYGEVTSGGGAGGAGVCGVRGRVRANAAQLSANGQRGLAALIDRERSLMAKGEHRRTAAMVAVAPAGTGDMSLAPDRADYPRGAEGTAAYE